MNFADIALYSFFFLILSWGSRRLLFIPIFCLLLGIIWGFFGSHPDKTTLQFVAKTALVFFLFVEGVKLHIPKIVRYHSVRLPTIGLLVTLVLGVGLLKLIFPLSLKEAFFVTLPLLAIDGKVVSPAFFSHIPPRISQMLNVEGAFTTLFAFFSLSLLHLSHPFHFFLGIFFPLIAGSVLGYICGLVGKTALEYDWAQNDLFRGAFFLIPFAIFSFCELFHSNGFIGVIAAGVTFGHTGRFLCDSLFDLSRRQAPYLFYLLLILFGIFSFHILSIVITFTLIFFALSFLFGIRFLAIFISFQKSQFQWKTLGYFTFFSPKGLIPIAVAFLSTEFFSFPNENLMLSILLTTTLFSLLIHSLFAYPIAMTYARRIHRYPKALEHFPTVSIPT